MPIVYNEGASANTNLANWSKADIYQFTNISGLGTVICHGPTPGLYTLALANLPPHIRIRYKVFWHAVDSLDNEQNAIWIDGVMYAEFRIQLFQPAGNQAVFTVNRMASSNFIPATYSYAPWGSGNTNNGYIAFDSGFIEHTSSILIVDHNLGHDQAQSDEAQYLSHIEVETFTVASGIVTNGLYLWLDAGKAGSYPGRRQFTIRANITGTTDHADFIHYQRVQELPIDDAGKFPDLPPQRVRLTTTTSTSTSSTTTEPPTPITVNITLNINDPVLAHTAGVVTFTLSEPVVSFALSDVMYAGIGTLDTFFYDGQTTATAILTPLLNQKGSYSIFVPVNSLKNAVNTRNSVSNTLTVTIDSIRPTMTVSSNDLLLSSGQVANLTFISSNATASFNSTDISLFGNAALDVPSFIAESSTRYSVNVVPQTNYLGRLAVNVANNRFTNIVGNYNLPSNTVFIDIDTRPPSMELTANTAFVNYSNVSKITFTSNLTTSDFALTDVTKVGFGVLDTFLGTGTTYTAIYSPPTDKIEIRASNFNQPLADRSSYIKLPDGSNYGSIGRGHTAAFFDTVSSPGQFDADGTSTHDTYGDPSGATASLLTFLNTIPTGNLLVMTSFDATTCSLALRHVLNDQFGGVRHDTWTSIRYSHVFIGYKNTATVLVNEGLDPSPTLSYWTPTDTYTMTYGSLGSGVGHGYLPQTNFTLSYPSLGVHNKLRYSFYWHFVDSIDSEIFTLTIDGVTYLEFTRNLYNASSSTTVNKCAVFQWVDNNGYSYSPFPGSGLRDGYYIVDTGWINHTSGSVSITAYFAADQAQSDEAVYITHARLAVSSDFTTPAYEDIVKTGTYGYATGNVQGVAGTFVANVMAEVYTSANGSPNTTSNDFTIDYNTRRPWVSIFSADESLTTGETGTVITIVLSEDPNSTFALSDIVVTGPGTLSNFQTLSTTIYTALLTPSIGAIGTITIYVPENRFTGKHNNLNMISNLFRIDVDLTPTTTTSTSTTTTEAPYSFDNYPCPATVSFNGGLTFPSEFRVDLGSGTTGTVTFTFDAFSVPDRFVVIYNGTIVFDSGYVTGVNPSYYPQLAIDVNTELANLPGSHVIQGVTINHPTLTASDFGPNNSSPGITFAKIASARYAYIGVFAPISGTAWQITMSCPA